MAVYVDDMLLFADVPNGSRVISGNWSHLMADTDEELHTFALRLGLRREWAQYEGTWKSHYDVTESIRRKALRMGAILISWLTDGARLTECKRQGVPFVLERDAGEPTLFDD